MAARTILAEFHKLASGRLELFTLTVLEVCGDHVGYETYDVEWSRTCGCYLYHMSGGGGRSDVAVCGPYFMAGPVEVRVTERPTDLVSSNDEPPWRSPATRRIRRRNRTRRLLRLPKEFNFDGLCNGADLLDWLHRNAIEEDAVYCSICRDWLPGDRLCKHTWWCHAVGWYSTPGDREREPCTQCIGGHCRDRFEMTPIVHRFDGGALWFWTGQPELVSRHG